MRLMSLPLVMILILSVANRVCFAEQPAEVLTLERAIALALQNNPALQAASATIDVMHAKVQDAHSQLWPKVNARFVFPFISTESGVSLQQHLWDFRRTQHLVAASQAQVTASVFDQATSRADIILQTKIAYYTGLAQQLMVDAATTQLRESERRVEQLEALFKTARVKKIDVTKAQINLGNARLSVMTTHNTLEKAKLQLAFLLGIEGGLPYQLEPQLAYDVSPIDIDQARANSLALRPEIRRLEAQETAVVANVSAARQDLYPTIFGRVEYRIKGEGASQPAFIAGIGVRYTLFDGFSRVAKIKEEKANLRHAQTEMISMKRQIATEIKRTYLDIKLAEESIHVTEVSQRSAKENLTVAQERYRLGRASAVELAEAESLAASATAEYGQAIYNYKIALAQFERASGKRTNE